MSFCASSRAAPVILLTGRPGIGKTTAIRHIVAALDRLHPALLDRLHPALLDRLHPALLDDRAGGFYTRGRAVNGL